MEPSIQDLNKTCETVIELYTKKSNYKIRKTLLLAILSGIFIAIGAYASQVAAYMIDNPSIAKLAAGVVFPIGLILVLFVGTDLFTGNTMMLMACYDKKVAIKSLIKNLSLVFLGNLIGILFIVIILYLSGTLKNASLVDYIFKVASNKANLTWVNALFSGIGCNIIVCVTIWISLITKDIVGKFFGIFFTIFVFVITGFEHCIANLYYFSVAIICKLDTSILSASSLAIEKIDSINIINVIKNLAFSTTGNIIGGGVVLSGVLYLIYKFK